MSASKRSRLRAAAFFASIALFVSSFLPVWNVMYCNDWEGTGEVGSLWWVIWEANKPSLQEKPWTPEGGSYQVFGKYENGAAITGALIAVAGSIGFWSGGGRWARLA